MYYKQVGIAERIIAERSDKKHGQCRCKRLMLVWHIMPTVKGRSCNDNHLSKVLQIAI